MSGAVEITTFKLQRGFSHAQFIGANADVDQWLAAQPGFQSRSIAERDDGSIVDMLLWERREDAVSAMQRLMVELADSPVHAVIDQGSVSWTVSSIFHSVPLIQT